MLPWSGISDMGDIHGRLSSPGTARAAIRGAIYGLIAWLVYGSVEFFLACLLPIALSSEKTFSPWDWRMVAILFGAYPVLGLVLGALSAVIVNLTKRGMEEFHYRLCGDAYAGSGLHRAPLRSTRRTGSERSIWPLRC